MMTRRSDAEPGSVYKRADGRWCASAKVSGKRKYIYGSTRGAVRKKLSAAQRAVEDGLRVPGDLQKLGAYLNRWLADVAAATVRASTHIRYRELLAGHVIPSVGHVPLSKLSPQDLNALYTDLSKSLAPRTIGHVHRVLHRALRDAVRWGLLTRNVCEAVTPPRVARQEMKVFTPEQSRRFLEAARNDPLEALYVLALTTGLRQGELLALRWEDLDEGAGRLSVRRSLRYLSQRGFVEGEPKTSRGRRNILLTPVALAALKRHQARQLDRRSRSPSWQDLGLVFPNRRGGFIQATNLLRRSFRPLLTRAGLPKIRFHDLRHSTATLLLLAGVHAKIVSEILGHSTVSFTLDAYSHVLPSMQAEATAKMEALLAPAA